MKRNQITPPTVKTEVILLDGGINENVSSLEMKAGELIACKNYYVTEGSTGGYVSLEGYERFDGQTKPSEATYKVLTVDITGVIAPGDTIEGAPKSWSWNFNDGTVQGWYPSVGGYLTNIGNTLQFQTIFGKPGSASIQVDGLLTGYTYDLFFDYTYESKSGAALVCRGYDVVNSTSAFILSSSISAPRNNNKLSFVAPSSSLIITFYCSNSATSYYQGIDNVRLELHTNLLGNGEVYTVLSGTGIINAGDFTYGAGWTIFPANSGYITATAGSASTLTHNPSLAAVAAKTYSYTLDVTRTAGTLELTFGGDTTGVINASGTYLGTFTTINTDPWVLTKDAAFAGTVDNLYIQLEPSPFVNPTATVVSEEDDYIIITDDTAAFGSSNLEVGGVVVGTCIGPQTSGSAVIAPYAKEITSDYYRSLIDTVPGQGTIRGIHVYNGKVYVFRDADGGATVGMYVESATGWDEVDPGLLTLAPGGTYSFINYNFSGASFTEAMFWVNGVDKAAYFDGTTITQITTGMTTDTPNYIGVHGDRLWLTFTGGSLQYSNVGDPTDWGAGAGEIGVGYEITGLVGSVGDTLLVFGDSHIKVLEGSDVSTWVFKFFSDSVGAYPHTICKLFDTVIFASHMGITTLSAAQEFGDFASNSISEKVKRTLFAYKDLITCATVVRSLNQYRIFFSNGKGIIFSFYNKKLRGATVCEYLDPVYIVTEGERSDTTPVNYFAGITEYVYQMDSGTSFDGEEIISTFSIPYFHYNSPRYLKRFLRSTFEITSLDPKTFYIKPNFDYNMTPYPKGLKEEITVTSAGAVWGEGVWGTMMWSGTDVTNRVFYDFLGIGGNMSITISSSSSMTRQHTFQNLIVDYIILGRQM